MPQAPRSRSWSSLAPGTRRRWTSAYGGPRSLPAATRARRAERAYEAGAALPAGHTGHEPPPVVEWSGVPTTGGIRPLETRSRVESRRVGEYSADVRRLLEGELDPADFARRWRRRRREAGGFELQADPFQVIANATAAGPAPEPYYLVRRRLRRAA